jgi:hypothetical protein
MAENENLEGSRPQPSFGLNLFSFAKLESLLGFKREYLRWFAANAGSCYDPFAARKKSRPFPKKPTSVKLREIDNPSPELKAIQRAINTNLLRPLEFPIHVCGGVKGRSVVDNAKLHEGAKVLVTMDIRKFFPSVSSDQIHAVWYKQLNCSPRISALLTQLTTFERRLPQGAPTSTLLANLVLLQAGEQIWKYCEQENIIYSCWVDDLAFSGPNARTVIQTAIIALRSAGFRVARDKMKISGPGDRKMLTGRMLGRVLSLHPQYFAWIRSGIHKLANGLVPGPKVAEYVASLEAKIKYISSIVPRKAIKLREALIAAKMRQGDPSGARFSN